MQERPLTLPEHAPEWVTPELFERTYRVFARRYSTLLSADDILQIILNVGRLIDALEV